MRTFQPIVARAVLRQSRIMPSFDVKRAVMAAAQSPRRTVGVAALLMALALIYTASAFDMTTDTGGLISAHTPWRVDEAAVEGRFPALKDGVLVVVDGATPEIASDGADRLAAALGQDANHFVSVRRPDGGAFFAREGLLFSSLPQVQATTQRLIDAQPLLGPLAADPSLRGIARAIDTAATGAANDPAKAQRLTRPLAGLATAIDARAAGRAAYFSWGALFADGGTLPPTRQLVLAQPNLAFGDLQPGAQDTEALRQAAARLQLDDAHGVHLGITGAAALADEEFGSIRDSMGVVGTLMALAMALCLWFATRSRRQVAAILVTIMAGLVITLALGLAVVHRLNVISVAFIPLFVGLGVDFGIQVCVRFNAERRGHNGGGSAAPLPALEQTAGAIGAPLLMAAGAICLALGAFLPTDYTGIAELGVIAGLGMMVALALNVTLLPALLMLLRPPVPAREVGWAGAAPLDGWLARHRRGVLAGFVAAMLGSVALLPWVQFDFNPMHLRDPHAPAMRALADLTRDADRTPNTIEVLAPGQAAADALAARLARLPQVAHAVTLSSFVPDDQAPKLALIQDASLLLDTSVNPFDFAPPSDDAATVAAVTKASASLKTLSAQPGALGVAAGRLAASFAHLAAATPAQRAGVEAMLVQPLNTTLGSLRAALQAGPVTRETLPAEIRADWLAGDGSALVSVTPKNGMDNASLRAFSAAVLAVAPHATGLPIATQAAAATVSGAFIRAGLLALLLVTGLLYAVLRSLREVAFTLAPVVLSGFLTLGTCVLIGQPLNFANIIAFPLLFGVGVAFHIYFVMAWRRGTSDLLQTSLARAVVFSALATGSAFGALGFSHHPGTASMGLILMISLVWTLVCALIFEPALLGPVETRA